MEDVRQKIQEMDNGINETWEGVQEVRNLNEETTRQILEIRQENVITRNHIAALAPRNEDLEKTFTDLPRHFMEQQQKMEMLQQAMQQKDEANEAALADS